MPRKKKEEKQLDGTVDIKQAVDALCDIEKDYGILPEESSNFRGFFCTCL